MQNCSSSKETPVIEDSRVDSERRSIVNYAKQQIGDTYKYGAKGPNSFDCSGLVSYVYKSEGIKVSGSADHIYKSGRSIPTSKAQPGDLIFYKKNNRIFHVSIVSQNSRGQFWVVHSTTSRGVIEEDIMRSTYWKPKIFKVISLDSLK